MSSQLTVDVVLNMNSCKKSTKNIYCLLTVYIVKGQKSHAPMHLQSKEKLQLRSSDTSIKVKLT